MNREYSHWEEIYNAYGKTEKWMCHNCGCVKHDLKLSERVYKCPECGFTIDRDLNAALNLKDAQIYKIIL